MLILLKTEPWNQNRPKYKPNRTEPNRSIHGISFFLKRWGGAKRLVSFDRHCDLISKGDRRIGIGGPPDKASSTRCQPTNLPKGIDEAFKRSPCNAMFRYAFAVVFLCFLQVSY